MPDTNTTPEHVHGATTLAPRTKPREVALPRVALGPLEEIATDIGLAAPIWQIGAHLAPALPREVHEALLAFRHAQDDGALLIHGVGPGPMPTDAASYSDLPVAGPLLLGLVALAAIPAYVPEEWDGRAITDVKVTAGLETTTSSKSMKGLPLHQETQPLEHPADGLALLMVRGGCPTRLAAMVDVVRHLSVSGDAETLDTLRKPEFVHSAPHSVGASKVSESMPILFGPNERPELRVDLATTHATNDASDSALAALATAADEIAADIPMEPGSLIMIDNRRWLHGRGELGNTGRDRWLLRTYFVCDSWSTQRADDGFLTVSVNCVRTTS